MIVAYNSYTKQNKDITITRKMFLDTGEYDYGMKEDDGRLTVCLNADKGSWNRIAKIASKSCKLYF